MGSENLDSPGGVARGQSQDGVFLPQMMTGICVPRAGVGHARTYQAPVLTCRTCRSTENHMAIVQWVERIYYYRSMQ